MASVNSPQDITLQLAGRSDAQAIAAMSRDLIESGLGWEYRPERIGAMIADRDISTLVARDGDKLMGFAIMSFHCLAQRCKHAMMEEGRLVGNAP